MIRPTLEYQVLRLLAWFRPIIGALSRMTNVGREGTSSPTHRRDNTQVQPTEEYSDMGLVFPSLTGGSCSNISEYFTAWIKTAPLRAEPA